MSTSISSGHWVKCWLGGLTSERNRFLWVVYFYWTSFFLQASVWPSLVLLSLDIIMNTFLLLVRLSLWKIWPYIKGEALVNPSNAEPRAGILIKRLADCIKDEASWLQICKRSCLTVSVMLIGILKHQRWSKLSSNMKKSLPVMLIGIIPNSSGPQTQSDAWQWVWNHPTFFSCLFFMSALAANGRWINKCFKWIKLSLDTLSCISHLNWKLLGING